MTELFFRVTIRPYSRIGKSLVAALSPTQGTSLVKRAGEILEEAAQLTSGVDPNYIRDAEPDSVFEAIPLAMARQGCRRYAEKGGDYPPLRAARAERACRPYLDSLEYGEGPQIDLPFRGGQCSGINYTVTIASTDYPFSDCSTFGEAISSNGFAGPIRGLRFAVVNPSGELCTPGRNIAYLQHGAPGNETVVAGGGYGVEARIISVVPELGGPDNCGNPAPEYKPPIAPTVPDPPGPVPFVRAPDIDIDIDVDFNIDGSINIDIGTGPITIDPFDEPEGGDDGGGGGDEPVPPGYQGEPADPIDVAPGDAADETSGDANLVGVLVQTIETPPRANRIFNPTESYTKGAYFVYFGGNGGLSINPEAAITIDDQFFYAPEGANRFRVVPNAGFTIRVTPFYNEAE